MIYGSKKIVSFFGPCAPRMKMSSRSPVRLGPVMNERKLGQNGPPFFEACSYSGPDLISGLSPLNPVTASATINRMPGKSRSSGGKTRGKKNQQRNQWRQQQGEREKPE